MSVLGRFGVDLGSLLGVIFAPLGAFFPLKWLPEPSSKRLIFEKVNLHEILRFPILLGSPGSHMAPPKRPRSLQDGSLILLDRFFSILDFRFVLGSVLGRFGAPIRVPGGAAPLG